VIPRGAAAVALQVDFGTITTVSSLAEVYVATLPAGVAAPLPVDVLEPLLREHASTARAAYPALALDELAFAAELGRRSTEHDASSLQRLHAADLYLACAAGAGERAAASALDRRIVPEIEVALRRMRLAPATHDDVVQQLRAELLTPGGALASYAGRGDLGGWVRVVATRLALRRVGVASRELELDDAALAHLPAAELDPRAAHLRQLYTGALKAAVADALAALEPRQRNLLRQHLLDELSIDELAAIYQVHRATCARWLSDAREQVRKQTRRRLLERLGTPAAELDSILRYLDSDLELSLPRLLGPT
jgi:RNA polymerase sigma-70 factor, ECF subfamily